MDVIKALISVLKKLLIMLPQKTTKGPVRKVQDVSLIKDFEGLELTAYKDIVGVWTIGYGHTKTARPGMSITKDEAEGLLRDDLAWVEDTINTNVKIELTQDQYDALASFIYNVGAGAFKRSTMLRKLNAGDVVGAAAEFKRWNKAGGKAIRGLTRRRKAEEAWFNGHNGT